MNWASFQTHNDAPEQAFESMCNQLFERWCRRTYGSDVQSFRAINGAGGDGGVEAYVQLKNGDGIGHQAKWFSNSIEDLQIRQIHGSVTTAKKVRPQIKHYIICVPRNLASLKMGKGSQIVKNPEESKVATLLETIKSEHSELTVDLWDEHRILEELQQSGAEGILRYWFDKEEITNDIFKNNFLLAKSGWLRNRYIPALHMQGKIASSINSLLRTNEARVRLFEAVSNIKSEIELALGIINTCYEEFNQSDIGFDAASLKESFENILCVTNNTLNAICHGDDLENQNITEIKFQELLEKLEEKPQKSGLSISIYVSRFKRSINKLMEMDVENLIRYAVGFLRQQNIIVIGDPGTGKTHGLAYAVQERIDKGYPAIIIQAKNAPVADGWGTIVAKAMGLSSTWTTEALWSALEGCAARIDVKRASADPLISGVENENTRVLICVDGIDESSEQEEWINRIGELTALKILYPRICFCISSRPHVFREKTLDDINSYVGLRSDGDVPVNKMFDHYIGYYKINTIAAPWIKWAIQSPLALKLFCELYVGKTIANNESINLSVSELIRRKLEIVEKELITKVGNKWSENEAVALRSLVSFSKYFLEHYDVNRKDACQLVLEAQHTEGIVTTADAGMILDHFCNCGLLIEHVKPTSNPLEIPIKYYQISYTQLTDYLIAVSGLEQVIGEGVLPSGIKNNYGSRAMVALMLLSDRNILVGDNGLLEKELPSDEILRLRLFALANVHYKKAELFSPWVQDTILKSKATCRIVTEGLIVKVSRQQGHPLGAVLIHKILKDMPSMAVRDILWSGPDRLLKADLYAWGGISNNPVSGIQLCEEDRFDGLPLLLAWALTTVDERVRSHCRIELIKWGIKNISQLVSLLQLAFLTNDLQMKEDLASIACIVTCLSDRTTEEMALLANWATEVVFSRKMENCPNIVIRQSCRAIIEKAFELGVVKEDAVQTARPPYNTNEYLLPLDKDVLEGNENTFFPISGDLDWYVIKKAYEPFFGHYRENENNIEQNDNPVIDLSSEVICAALGGRYGELTPELHKALQEINNERNRQRKFFGETEISFQDETNQVKQDDGEIDELIKKMLEEKNDINDTNPVKRYAYQPLAEHLLKQYEEQYALTIDNPHRLVKAICYSFMKQWGWNYKDFIGQPNGGKEGEVLGIDIAIIREYTQATHGSRSNVMSFKEKYVWLAVHNIIGFFSDRLEFKDNYDSQWKKITDYNDVTNIQNSSREVYKEFDNEIDISQWFLPTEICPPPLASGIERKQMLIDWIKQDALFDIGPWLCSEGAQLRQIYNDLPIKTTTWYSINIFSISTEKTTQGQSLLWGTAFLTGRDEFELLMNDIKVGTLSQSIAMGYESVCNVKCKCYISPVDVVTMPWIQEVNYIGEQSTIKDSQIVRYTISPAVTKVMDHLIDEGDIEYKIPSKIIRQVLGITNTTGTIFFNNSGEVVSFASESGENHGESQEILLCRGDILDEYLRRENKIMFWVIRLLREADPAMKEQLKVYNARDRILLIWLEDGRVNSSIISDMTSEE